MAEREELDEYGYPLRPPARRRLRKLLIQISKRTLLTTIYLALSSYGLLLRCARLARRHEPLDPQRFRPRRILVIRLDLIGDLVLSLTLVHALKRTYPEAEIDLLAMPSTAPIAGADPDLAQIITYDPNIWRRPQALVRGRNWREAAALLSRLRTRHYDLAVSVFGPWAALLSLLSGARRRVGFAGEGYAGFMTDPVPGRHWQPGDRRHEVDYCLELARAAGVSLQPEDRFPRLHVDPEARLEVERLLKRLDPAIDLDDEQEHVAGSRARPLVVCHVASHNGYAKRWPIPYWARLLTGLAREAQAHLVLTGARGDLPLILAILQRLEGSTSVLNLAGQTNLPQLAALMQMADLVISGDSGPMHIAAATGTPLIAIHGPTDPALSGPVSPQATIVRSGIWCSPCYDARSPADCRFHTVQCMKEVSPEQVLTLALRRLQKRQPAPSAAARPAMPPPSNPANPEQPGQSH
ncbi:heptosyltransferase II [Thermogemmatispora aurantia]|uniref:lipopolysaccharide heptosyltransferase II n=1 Tax=Thermogemmatispora aurantia TaxID=2045279 RepID=A0A5J4K7Q1_9CHLR|nr:lipopolysaccharide heptosyltransferase II [Thermogemmatispora aurantia]GER82176.1 heptosyltransferase II [Thermogemmatispora aurantia]